MSKFFSYSDSEIEMEYRQDVHPVPSDFVMHTHEMYELYYFAEGNAVYRVEGSPYPLQKGDILIMRPAEAHYVDVSENAPYTRLWIDFKPDLLRSIDPTGRLLSPFNDRKIGTNNLYRAENFKSDSYNVFIQNMMTDSPNKRLQVITNLLPLLNEIVTAFDSTESTASNQTLDSRIIDYINRHITKDISLDSICERFFISKSHLCRFFKKATASTVGEYITLKRLINARQLMLSGVPPTKAYLESGFKDYSAFYRAFTKKYGVSPSMFIKSV